MQLDERKYLILQAIIDDYIMTAMPVGSRTISRKSGVGYSPATIRNEMSDLEELGYLDQPHTSAGRVPSNKAYRLYVDHLMKTGEDVDDIYTELKWTSVADTFPAKFDLRDRGTVTPVRSQSPWGTCWSFATIAASENSILNSLGLTTDSYREKYGEELDLSEKHLAWTIPKGNIPMRPHRREKAFIFWRERISSR